MKLMDVKSAKDKKKFIDFVYSLYLNNPCYKDSLMTVMKRFLYRKDGFIRKSFVRPLAVVADNGDILAQCILFYHPGLPMMQVAFFEALAHQEQALDLMFCEAERCASEFGLKETVYGLNGHLQYGVGYLTSDFHKPAAFDSHYSQPYYPEYFRNKGFDEKKLKCYGCRSEYWKIDPRIVRRVRQKISFRTMFMGKFREELLQFSRLCNETLKDNFLYYERDPVYLAELVNELRLFLKPENLIFALHEGKEIGFIFWHPDYNQVVRSGRRNSVLAIGLDYLLGHKKINRIKLNAIGVLPEYQKLGVAPALVEESARYVTRNFDYVETNFVWDSNLNSRLMNESRLEEVTREYSVFIARTGV